ncbi:MAG: hypothetical protein JRH20_22345 [Deltaproteobacteria bacterium]|nr:hypothetical protein [Deltaproteobacteria bacterium]
MTTIKARTWLVICGLTFSMGCGGLAEDETASDGRHDTFLTGGKADTAGIKADSVEARAVLKLANEASYQLLDDPVGVGGVGLDKRAARNIVAFRQGADGLEGSGDDVLFVSLVELDAISYVGPRAFGRMLTFALENGYAQEPEQPGIDLPVEACVGDFAPVKIMDSWHQGSWLDLRLVRYVRVCDEVAGVTQCKGWEEKPLPGARSAYGGYTDDVFQSTVNTEDGVAVLAVKGTRSSTYNALGTFTQLPGATSLSLTFQYQGYTDVCDDYSYGGGWGSGGCLRSHYAYWTGAATTPIGRAPG